MAHLLIVDDEQSICWGLSKLGQSLGHTVDVAASAEEGFDLARERCPGDCPGGTSSGIYV